MLNELTIATYNIHDGREPESIVKNIIDLKNQGVSLFCLQEVRPVYKGYRMAETLNSKLESNIKKEYFWNDDENFLDHGLGTLWDSSVIDQVSFFHLELPQLPRVKIWEKLFFRLHGLKTNRLKRGALVGTFSFNGTKIRITNAHLDFQGGSKQRARQITHIKQYLDSQKPVDCEVVCGDFNTLGLFNHTKNIATIESLLPGFKNVFSKSYITLHPHQQLDYMLIKGCEVKNAKISYIPGSDHFPIIAKLKLL